MRSKPFKCLLYGLYFLVAAGINAYLLSKVVRHDLKQKMVAAALAVFAGLTAIFLVVLGLWVWEFVLARRVDVLQVKQLPGRHRESPANASSTGLVHPGLAEPGV